MANDVIHKTQYVTAPIFGLTEPAIRKKLLLDALFNWQSVACLATMVVIGGVWLAAFIQKLYLIWGLALLLMLVCLIAESLYLYTRLGSKSERDRVMTELFRQRLILGIDQIRDKGLKARLLKAFEYWHLINDLIAEMQPGPMRSHILPLVRQAMGWLDQIYSLVWRVHQRQLELTSRPDPFSQRPNNHPEIDSLKKTMRQLDEALQSMNKLCRHLRRLHNRPETDRHLTTLQSDISDQVSHLEDLVEAMQEIVPEMPQLA